MGELERDAIVIKPSEKQKGVKQFAPSFLSGVFVFKCYFTFSESYTCTLLHMFWAFSTNFR